VRLFVGFDVPVEIGRDLAALQLPAAADAVPVLPADMHVTLQFLGERDAAAVGAALAGVHAERFNVVVTGLGEFRMRGGRRIVWAGIESSSLLAELRAGIGGALAELGIESERRAFRPHVTLARLGSRVPAWQVDGLLQACAGRDFGCFEVREFVLYDSAREAAPYRYERYRRYPLD
jgi:2'-5' RNA ligase